jgi:PiT family inorganic phosphate transporter
MGLIMLILVGTVPTAYALNHAVTPSQIDKFMYTSSAMVETLDKYVDKNAVLQDEQQELEGFISTKKYEPGVMLALRQIVVDIRNEVTLYGSLKGVPQEMQANVRNQMYLASETLRLMGKNGPKMSADDTKAMAAYKVELDMSTKFIPPWVKVAVALALGMGTMIGWKRIVVTVGEKIGKTHLTYAQGAAAELVTMATILGADSIGVPVSTTHILSSGVAGTMAANKSGLQLSTVRDIALAWVFTLPAAALLSGCLFWAFNSMAK